MSRTITLLFLLFAITGTTGFAQKNVTELIHAGAAVIQPEARHGELKKLPFRSIRIIDSRFDTSKFGYVKRGSYKKLTTGTALPQALETFLQTTYKLLFDATAPHEAVIVIKHLWLQETSSAEQDGRKMERSSQATQPFSSCTAVLELYLATGDAYRPLFRSDTVFKEKNLLRRCAGRLLTDPFAYCLAKAEGMDLSKIVAGKRSLMWSDIAAFNARRMQRPAATAGPSEKGIYKTFADFLQHRIAREDFKVTFGAHTDEVFVTTGGRDVLLTEYWGVCDGAKTYMRIGYGLFELAKQNNTYELWGSKLSIHKLVRADRAPVSSAGGMLTYALLYRNRMETEAKPLQLNMDTGSVY